MPVRFMILFLLSSIQLLWSASAGAIKGYVKDSSGALVPGAAVVLQSADTNATLKSNADGLQ